MVNFVVRRTPWEGPGSSVWTPRCLASMMGTPVFQTETIRRKFQPMSMHKSVRKMRPFVSTALSTVVKQVLGVTNRREFAIVQNLDAAIVATVSTDSDAVKGETVAAGGFYVHFGNGPLFAKSASGTPNLGIIEFVDSGEIVRADEEITVALSTTRAKVLNQDDRRICATFENDDAAIAVTLGDETVTAGNGLVLAPSQSTPLIVGQMAWYAVAASGTPNLGISTRKR